MKKKISRIISFILAAQMLLAPVTAFADSNVITNITGSAAYLAAASGPTTMKTDGKTFAIEADVYVCTNPDGKWIEDGKSFALQGNKVETITYWPKDFVSGNRKIISTEIPMDDRRDGGRTIGRANLKDEYSWVGYRDREMPDSLPSPLSAGADSFRSWSNEPKNMTTTIEHAVAAYCNHAGEPTETDWKRLFDSNKSSYTDLPDLKLKDFVATVNEETGKVDCSVEWFVAYSIKVLYRENNTKTGEEELLFVDCNQMGELNQAFASDFNIEETKASIAFERSLQKAAEAVVGYCRAFLKCTTPVGIGEPFSLDDYAAELLWNLENVGKVNWGTEEISSTMQEIADEIIEIVNGTGKYRFDEFPSRMSYLSQKMSEYQSVADKHQQSIVELNTAADNNGSSGLGLYYAKLGSFSHVTHPQSMYLSHDQFGHSSTLEYDARLTYTSGGRQVQCCSDETLLKKGGWCFAILEADPARGVTIIAKDRETDETLEGLVVELTAGNYEEEETSGDNGRVNFPDVPFDTEYEAVEIEPPTGYDAKGYTEKDKLTTDKPSHEYIWYYDKAPKSQLTVNKVDENDKPVKGAVFKIYRKNDPNSRYYDYYCDLNMSGSSSKTIELPPGMYFIQEVEAPNGYILVEKKYTFQITEGDTTVLKITNVKDETGNAEFFIEENELSRAFSRPVNFTSRFILPNTPTVRSCGCYIKQRENRPDKKVVCHHRVGFHWDGGNDIFISHNTYIGSGIFNENNAISLYRIVRDAACTNLKMEFNTNGDLWITEGEASRAYHDLNRVDWISHRTGINSTPQRGLQLAEYMNDTTMNKKYIEFSESTYGTPRSAYEDPDGNTNAGSFSITTVHGGTGTRFGEEKIHTRYKSGDWEDYSADSTVTNDTLQFNVGAHKTYKASPHEYYGGSAENTMEIDTWKSNNGDFRMMTKPSPVFTFYPTYPMNYADTLGEEPDSQAWMLAYGERKVQFTDYATIRFNYDHTYAVAPWSRDRIDRDNEKGYPVIKAGGAIRAITDDGNPDTKKGDDGTEIAVSVMFHFQDPKYNPDADEINKKSLDNALAFLKQIDDKMTDINSYGYYSNVWELSSENAPDCFKVDVSKSWARSEKPKSSLELMTEDAEIEKEVDTYYYPIAGKWHADKYGNTLHGVHDSYITIGGTKFKFGGRYTNDIGTGNTGYNLYPNSDIILDEVLEHGKGYTKNWYNEYYEGIALAQIHVTYKINNFASEYAQVHSRLSDWVTRMNDLAEKLPYTNKSQALIKKGDFGIGLVVNIGKATWYSNHTGNDTSYTYSSVYPVSKPYLFGIRAHVYDLGDASMTGDIKHHMAILDDLDKKRKD